MPWRIARDSDLTAPHQRQVLTAVIVAGFEEAVGRLGSVTNP